MTEGVLYSLDAVARTPHIGILLSAPHIGAQGAGSPLRSPRTSACG